MVKPPNSMRPESIDLSKAGRSKTRPFQDSSFHNYMARKIHLQRKQFGLVLPPSPSSSSPSSPMPTRPLRAADRKHSWTAITSPPPTIQLHTARRSRKAMGTARGDDEHPLTDFSSHQPFEHSSVKKRRKSEPSKKQRVSFSLDVRERSSLPRTLAPAPAPPADPLPPRNMGEEHDGRYELSGILHRLKRTHGESTASSSSQSILKTNNRDDIGIPIRREDLTSSSTVTDANELTSTGGGGAAAAAAAAAAACSSSSNDNPHPISPQPHQFRKKESLTRRSAGSSKAELVPPRVTYARASDGACSGRPDLFFRGVVVLINGYTEPDAPTLQRLLHRHGGDVEKYETDRVNVVIASELSHAKAAVYRNMTKKPIPVIRPGWIVNCVQRQRLLPYQDYILGRLRINRNGGRVQSIVPFFAPNPASDVGLTTTAASVATHSMISTNRSRPTGNVQSLDFHHHLSNRAREAALNNCAAGSNPVDRFESVQLAQFQESTHDEDASAGREEEDISSLLPRPNREASPPSSPAERSRDTMIPARRTDDKYINGRVRTVGTDPNFLENFFSKSRLSFIGSFKQRARTSPGKTSKNHQHHHESLRTERWVLHVDIDSFFASVVLRDYPHYRDMPVVISHQATSSRLHQQNHRSSSSTSECATCNYKAREVGIRKGMFLGRAHELCRDAGLQLVVLPYNFEAYEDVKEKVADILFRYGAELDGRVNQVSCDESYVELHLPVDSDSFASSAGDAESLARSIRREIFDATECTASIGVAKNMFLAKLGTGSVKPDGCCVVRDYRELLAPLKLRQLPGIGRHLEKKLDQRGLSTVQNVWDLGDDALAVLESLLGAGTGKKVYNFCCGRDDRPVVASERKSIGAECSYGVRFNGDYGPDYMISCLASEVSKRMTAVGVRGGAKVTLKLKKRKPNAHFPFKFLGSGSCDSLSKSCDVPGLTPTCDASVLSKLCWTMYRQFEVPKEDIRGMGIVVSKLSIDGDRSSASADENGKQPCIRSWLNASDTTANERRVKAQNAPDEVAQLSSEMEKSMIESRRRDSEPEDKTMDPGFELPALSQIRMSQVEFLPSPMKRFVMSKIEVRRAQERWEAEHMFLQPKRPRIATSGVTFDPNLVSSRKRRKIDGAKVAPPASNLKHNRSSPSRCIVAVESVTPRSLFDEDVYPLSQFMDKHPAVEDEARDMVSTFLLTCVEERRLCDVVVLLRSIKNRHDQWSSREVFESILDQVSTAVQAVEGNQLDARWI